MEDVRNTRANVSDNCDRARPLDTILPNHNVWLDSQERLQYSGRPFPTCTRGMMVSYTYATIPPQLDIRKGGKRLSVKHHPLEEEP